LSKRDGGQSTVEFAFGLLVLAAIGVLGINSVVAVQHQIDITAIAREAALAAARSADPYQAAHRVVRSYGSDTVNVAIDSPQVTVLVRREISTVLRAVGINDLTASVTMPLEPP
jgi:Flp pilus assembly protein TadG